MKKILKRFEPVELSILLCMSIPAFILVFLSEKAILGWYTTDDAFYYFETARNIAQGLGSTFDGIALTNGYHPLWMLICIPIFALADVDLFLPLRLLILVQVAMGALSAILIYRLTLEFLPRPAAALAGFFWALTPAIYSTVYVGGIENALNGLMLIVVLYASALVIRKKNDAVRYYRRLIMTGFLASLTVLARLDNVFYVAFVGLWLLIMLQPWKGFSRQSEFIQRSLKMLLSYYLPIGLIVGVYMLSNYFIFGEFMPVSGQVKHWWGELYGSGFSLRELYLNTFTSTDKNIVPFWYPYSLGQAVARQINGFLASMGLPALMKTLFVYGAFGLLLLVDRKFSFRSIKGLLIVPLLFGVASQVAYYKLSGHSATRYWYWVSEMLLFLLLVVVVIGLLVRLIKRWRYGNQAAWGSVLVIALLLLVSNLRYFNRSFIAIQREVQPYLQTAEFIHAQTAPGDTIGLTGSGSAGYFTTGRTIINLDGLINSYEYFQHLQDNTAADYLLSVGGDYVLGIENMIMDAPPYKSNFPGRLNPVATHGSMTLWSLE
jgi:hypothetical protein